MGKNTYRCCGAILVFLFAFSGVAAEKIDLSPLFSRSGLTGTLVIESLDGGTTYVHNPQRADTGFIPASTFKIPNSLIALEEKAIRDEREVIPWDGKQRSYAAWNRDQTLASALRGSCVWFYQELARRIGDPVYLRYLEIMEYGNGRTGSRVDRFWLDGDLRISAREQVSFLRRLVRGDLPFREEHLETVKRIMIVTKTPAWTLRAKTGWVLRADVQTGWYVGWLEKKGGENWLFALNFDGEYTRDLNQRQEILMDALRLQKLIPPHP